MLQGAPQALVPKKVFYCGNQQSNQFGGAFELSNQKQETSKKKQKSGLKVMQLSDLG
jgi:hypothetical protein